MMMLKRAIVFLPLLFLTCGVGRAVGSSSASSGSGTVDDDSSSGDPGHTTITPTVTTSPRGITRSGVSTRSQQYLTNTSHVATATSTFDFTVSRSVSKELPPKEPQSVVPERVTISVAGLALVVSLLTPSMVVSPGLDLQVMTVAATQPTFCLESGRAGDLQGSSSSPASSVGQHEQLPRLLRATFEPLLEWFLAPVPISGVVPPDEDTSLALPFSLMFGSALILGGAFILLKILSSALSFVLGKEVVTSGLESSTRHRGAALLRFPSCILSVYAFLATGILLYALKALANLGSNVDSIALIVCCLIVLLLPGVWTLSYVCRNFRSFDAQYQLYYHAFNPPPLPPQPTRGSEEDPQETGQGGQQRQKDGREDPTSVINPLAHVTSLPSILPPAPEFGYEEQREMGVLVTPAVEFEEELYPTTQKNPEEEGVSGDIAVMPLPSILDEKHGLEGVMVTSSIVPLDPVPILEPLGKKVNGWLEGCPSPTKDQPLVDPDRAALLAEVDRLAAGAQAIKNASTVDEVRDKDHQINPKKIKKKGMGLKLRHEQRRKDASHIFYPTGYWSPQSYVQRYGFLFDYLPQNRLQFAPITWMRNLILILITSLDFFLGNGTMKGFTWFCHVQIGGLVGFQLLYCVLLVASGSHRSQFILILGALVNLSITAEIALPHFGPAVSANEFHLFVITCVCLALSAFHSLVIIYFWTAETFLWKKREHRWALQVTEEAGENALIQKSGAMKPRTAEGVREKRSEDATLEKPLLRLQEEEEAFLNPEPLNPPGKAVILTIVQEERRVRKVIRDKKESLRLQREQEERIAAQRAAMEERQKRKQAVLAARQNNPPPLETAAPGPSDPRIPSCGHPQQQLPQDLVVNPLAK